MAESQMALSQKVLRRIKQQGVKVGTSSRARSLPSKVILESDHETTQSDPRLKRRKVGHKGGDHVASESSDSNDWPSSTEVIRVEDYAALKRSFWD